MITVEEIKVAITQLPPHALQELRQWYQEFDADQWDAQIEADVVAGRLDRFADEALQSFRDGETTEL